MFFSSEHPATVFTVLEPPPPVGPQQQPGKQKLTFTSDTLFDLLLLKLEKFYQKRLKIESKGSRFELGDFVVKVRTHKSNWHLASHSVWFERDVRRIVFVVIFFQWTQNWTALNFEVNFQPLIQLNSRGSQNNFGRERPGLSRSIEIIMCLDAEASK